ncbi:hypothetical protein BD626DRAFT_485012 [Schizophyllum amplum]|uniref:Uncharacterized protein n=1 Tax=Schizophyllum amplum TaxID=97359 RepID=A0A550CQX0_9AGAR|nr:hypothetical protein BD626DRAFT_485012 [Auriculariopsis ampla]
MSIAVRRARAVVVRGRSVLPRLGDEYMDRCPPSDVLSPALAVPATPSASLYLRGDGLGVEYTDRHPPSRPLISRRRCQRSGTPHSSSAPPPSDEATYRRPVSRPCGACARLIVISRCCRRRPSSAGSSPHYTLDATYETRRGAVVAFGDF